MLPGHGPPGPALRTRQDSFLESESGLKFFTTPRVPLQDKLLLPPPRVMLGRVRVRVHVPRTKPCARRLSTWRLL